MDVRTFDGRNVINLTPKLWKHSDGRLFCIPENAASDGASAPDILASLGLTFWGAWWMDAYLHDSAYRNTLLQWKEIGGEWIWHQAALEKADCDEIFRKAMVMDHVDPSIVKIYHDGVVLGGQSSFDNARAKNPTQYVFQQP